ncbi:MAG: hypothetical protein RL141_23 [Candidatus Parcubacteria bacterium]|jgi:glycosyltransferase involved in cell wall biosynthesis
MSVISVIIPAWNHAEALGRCLASLEAQDEKNIEVIVVDDASTDETERVLRGVRPSFPFQVIRLAENRGAAAARNVGAERAMSPFLLFLDADVTLRRDALEKMRAALEANPGVAFVYASFRFGWKRFKSGVFDAARLQAMPYIHTTALLRAEAFPGFDESLKKFQDWDVWLTMVERGGRGLFIPEELFAVAVRKEGMSRWLPSMVHRLPWPILGWMPREIANYRYWERVVKEKHQRINA